MSLTLNGKPLEITKEICVKLLKTYIDKGFKSGCLSIKNGSELCKYFRILSGEEVSAEAGAEGTKVGAIYEDIFKSLEFITTKGAFSIDDAAVIYKLFEFVKKEQNEPAVPSVPSAAVPSVPSAALSSIREI